MKIKEVEEKTGLTDRAIRLYIENDLISPTCDVNFNGRKEIDFSLEDVNQLNNISILRKAGFSIAEIKSILLGGEETKHTVENFIAKTNENIEKNSLLIKSLEPLKDRDDLTIEIICQQLQKATSNAKVPVSDMKISTGEKMKNNFYITFAVVGLTIFLLTFIIFNRNYRYPHFAFNESWETHLRNALAILSPFVCPLVLLLIRVIPKKVNKESLKRRVLTIIFFVLTIISMINLPITMLCIAFNTSVISQTENPTYYLNVDEYVQMYNDDIYECFPGNIPRSAISKDSNWYPPDKFPKTTKYFYQYSHAIDPSFDIVAEWKLPKEEYDAEKESLLSRTDITGVKEKSSWTCVYYEDFDEDKINRTFYFVIFAYNDETNTVRYIISYCMDACDGLYKPYFYKLDWQ